MSFSYGEPITVTTVTQSGTDDYGDPVTTSTSITRNGAFAPAIGYESTNGQDQVVSQPQALFTGQAAVDVAAVISSTSSLTVRGLVYQVDGDPGDWRSPFTGWHAGLAVPLKRTAG